MKKILIVEDELPIAELEKIIWSLVILRLRLRPMALRAKQKQ